MTKLSIIKCKICETQNAHGNHFGVFSCRACAAFFRRTVHSRWSKLKCQGGSCDRETFFCKPCRLQRCFEKGMETSNFQYNRDIIIATTLSSSIPPKFEHFVGNPLFVMLREQKTTKKTTIDVYRLIGEAAKILSLGPNSPIFVEDSQLKKLSLAMDSVRFGRKSLKFAKFMTKSEITDNWEFYFHTVARWLVHFDEFKKLDPKIQMTLLKTIWHIWSRLEKLYTTSKYRKSCKTARISEIVIQGNVVVDIENVGFDSAWLSDVPTPQLRHFMKHSSCDQYDVTAVLGELQPTEVELTYMLAQLSFEYASKRHQNEEIQEICEKFQEILANDLHKYYVEEMNMPRYSRRLAKMIQVNNAIQKNIREGHERMEVIRVFNVFKLEFTHPEMFLDSGFH